MLNSIFNVKATYSGKKLDCFIKIDEKGSSFLELLQSILSNLHLLARLGLLLADEAGREVDRQRRILSRRIRSSGGVDSINLFRIL